MSFEPPIHHLYKILCISADEGNRPRCIESKDTLHSNQRIITSPHPFESVWSVLHSHDRTVCIPEQDDGVRSNTAYVFGSKEALMDLRMVLDRHFEIKTMSCIAIERFLTFSGSVSFV